MNVGVCWDWLWRLGRLPDPGCIISLLLAAICTMLLILLSRRATLRQINASLVKISEQLKQLPQLPASEPRVPTGTV